jgi:hypothetical protein
MIAPTLRAMATELGREALARFLEADDWMLVRPRRMIAARQECVDNAWALLAVAAKAWEQRRTLHRAIVVLRAVEWAAEEADEFGSRDAACPICAGFHMHAPDCALASLLRPGAAR